MSTDSGLRSFFHNTRNTILRRLSLNLKTRPTRNPVDVEPPVVHLDTAVNHGAPIPTSSGSTSKSSPASESQIRGLAAAPVHPSGPGSNSPLPHDTSTPQLELELPAGLTHHVCL
jgi:hypothetical protein